MFFRVLVAALVALPALVSATPAPGRPQTTSAVSLCNVGEIHCCEKIQVIPNHTSAATSGLFGSPISLLGSRCYPVSVLSIGGKNCADQLVCCEGKEFGRFLIVLSCSSINVNL